MTHPIRRTLHATLPTVATVLALAGPAQAQDYQAMIQQSMARMNNIVAQAENRMQGAVQQRMQDPAVQAAWQQYVARNGGRPAMNYPTFTYYYIYTNGFSSQGMAHMRATESGIQQREAAAWQGVRQAEAGRAAAQQGQRDAPGAAGLSGVEQRLDQVRVVLGGACKRVEVQASRGDRPAGQG